MADFKKLLADAKPPERTVPICLRADLTGEHERLDRELKQAQNNKGADSLEDSGAGALVEQIEALQAEMRENSYEFRLRALPKRLFRALLNEHPPRRDEETGDPVREDTVLGVNRDTFYPVLIRVSCVDPQLDDDEWRVLLGDGEAEAARRLAADEPVEDGKLTDWQFQELASTAFELNAWKVDVPFSRAALLAKRATGGE